MADYYGGHAQAFAVANQMGQHAADVNELMSNGWKTQSLAFKTLDHQEQDKVDGDVKKDFETDITKVDKVYGTGRAVSGAAGAFGRGFTRSLQQTAAGLGKGEQVTAEAALLGSGKVFTSAGVSGTAQAIARGGRGALATLTEAGQGSKLFATERFGAEGVTAAKDLTGVEGIAAAGILKAGGGEAFAKIGAKGLSAVGTGIAAYQDIDNLVETGNIFNTRDAAGNVVKQNLGVDVGNVATLVGGALDVAAAFTGGALAPIAAAVNLFAAVDSTVAGVEQDKAEKKQDETDMKPGAAPAAIAPQAFAQFGILANQAHNPLNHIN
jgi:hypothetical protein